MRTLKAAVIGGPAYDLLYSRIPEFERATGCRVEVAVRLPHPQLNAHLRQEFEGGGASYDLISTHTKYAPSQARWLLPLDDLVSPAEPAAFFFQVMELCRFGGRLIQAPRNLDLRLLYYRTDLFHLHGVPLPTTWYEFRALARQLHQPPGLYGTAFPGRHSGLFGTWFELLAMAGGRLFDDELRPAFASAAGEWALAYLHDLHAISRVTPPDLAGFHYEEVAELFRSGRSALALEWPGYHGLLNDSAHSSVVGRFGVARYPMGPAGARRVYAGCHSFAIPAASPRREEALALLRFLTSEQSQALEGMAGSIVPRVAAWEKVKQANASSAFESRRLDMIESAIQEDLLLPPKLAAFAAVEEAVWPLLQAGLTGQTPVRQALDQAHIQAELILGPPRHEAGQGA
jgi:multiple sugar transport system substrate-binding protein